MPYEADISAALQRLRKDVFARGDYVYGDDITDEQRKDILEKTRPEMEPWMQKVREPQVSCRTKKGLTVMMFR